MKDSERLAETVDQFCQFIAALPASALVEQDWGPKEVLAHLVFHHELYVKLVEAFLAGTPAVPPKGRFRDLNAAAVAAGFPGLHRAGNAIALLALRKLQKSQTAMVS